jgi:voltage-gated potassium channel
LFEIDAKQSGAFMKTSLSGLRKFIFGSYGGLLLALFFLILLQPVVNTLAGKYFVEFVFIVVLFTGLRAIEIRKSLLRFEGLLLLASLACYFAGTLLGDETFFILGLAGRVLFMILVALTILIDLFRAHKVSSDTLAGAVCVYLLIALVFGQCFLLIEFLVPESFSFTLDHGRMHLWLAREFFPFFYFSMVTMTTIGYGDMVPVSTAARTLATMEGVLGQVYLTILVARLVGMYLIHQQGKSDK